MPRAKRRSWQPEGIEIFDTKDIISDQALSRMLEKHLGTHSQEKTHEIQKRARKVTGFLRAGLHCRNRPTHGEKGDGLRTIAEKARETLVALDILDADSGRLLEDEADPPENFEFVSPGLRKSYHMQMRNGDLRLSDVRVALGDLEKWARSAYEHLGQKPSLKNKKLVDESNAINRLYELWKYSAKGTVLTSEPTEGPFREFVTDVLGPVRSVYGTETSMNGLINERLYGRKRR